jgi:hypothetical protein
MIDRLLTGFVGANGHEDQSSCAILDFGGRNKVCKRTELEYCGGNKVNPQYSARSSDEAASGVWNRPIRN